MRKRLIFTCLLILFVSLSLCIGVSLFFGQRNAINNAKKYVKGYAVILKDDYGNGVDFDSIINKMQIVDTDVRVTFVMEDGKLLRDSYSDYQDDFLEHSEFKELDKVIIRYDKEQDIKMMFYVIFHEDTYIRVGIPYEKQVSYITGMLWIMIVVAVSVFISMGLIIGKLVTREMKPLNNVISGLEGIVGSNNKYDYDNISDISAKINEVKEHIMENLDDIKFEKDKVEFILNNIGQGILVLDCNYEIRLMNEVAASFLEITKNQTDFLNTVKDEEIVKEIKIAHERNNYSTDIHKDGNIYNLCGNKITSKWLIRNKEAKGLLLVITDITEERIAEEKQKEFFSNASHELRSPLTSIIGFQDMIIEGIIKEDETLDIAKKTMQEGEKMLNLVNNMLNLSALELMKNPNVIEKVELDIIVKDVLEIFRPQIYKRKIKVKRNIEKVSVMANIEHMHQLIRNLIDNAIKYNKENGEIDIIVKSDEYAIISVQDNGVGISEEDRKRIFERFYRVDKARSRKIGSSGLGLAIVKQICNIYNAEIDVESKLGDGTKIMIKMSKV